MAKIRLRLKTPQQVRQALNRVINLTVNGEIDPKVANTIIYGCNVIISSIKTCDQEKKLAELEAILLEEQGK